MKNKTHLAIHLSLSLIAACLATQAYANGGDQYQSDGSNGRARIEPNAGNWKT